MKMSRLCLVSAFSLPLLVALACSSGEQGPLFGSIPGSAALRVNLASNEDIQWIEYRVTDGTPRVLLEDSVYPAPWQSIAFDFPLPPGNGYAIALTCGTVSGVSCAGATAFDVAAGRATEVTVDLVCAPPAPSISGAPAAPCPSVSIATPDTTLPVGDGIALNSRIEGDVAVTPVWTASAGQLDHLEGETRFTCTESGTAQIQLGVELGDSGVTCAAIDELTVSCSSDAPPASACDGLGSACHVVDPGDGVIHDCHDLGHQGDLAACAARRDGCIAECGGALCGALTTLCHDVDPGSGPLHDCHQLGHAGDAAACFTRGRDCFEQCSAASSQPVTIQFAARVGGAPFACGGAGVELASGPTDIEPRDFRFFVHDVRLIGSDGSEAPVSIEERAPFQALGSALLDFEDATGSCGSGDAATNTVISGRVRSGTYTGVSFRLGVPDAINHADPALQPAPFGAGTMSWGWLAGYKFLRAEVGSKTGSGAIHLGTTACTGDPAAGAVSCARSNRPLVTLAGFDVTQDIIVADLSALFATADLTSTVSCHSTEAACEPLFVALGLNLQDGSSGGDQSVFRVER